MRRELKPCEAGKVSKVIECRGCGGGRSKKASMHVTEDR